MTDLITKLNTAIAVLNDARYSMARYQNELDGLTPPHKPRAGYDVNKEDSKESIMRRLVVVRGMLNEINRELRGK